MPTHRPPTESDPVDRIAPVRVVRLDAGRPTPDDDAVAVEEPLEIRLAYAADGRLTERSVSITMRTPGDDMALAAGFLASEGILRRREDLVSLRHCGPKTGRSRNVVRLELAPDARLDLDRLDRHFYTTSSCGVCGKSSLEALRVAGQTRLVMGTTFDPAVIPGVSDRLREAQAVFDRTGGLHAAALFRPDGTLVAVREDVGRHNAVDKLLGAMWLEGRWPLSDVGLFLSGRASFELAQKAWVAGVPLVAAVGAPSSLAVELAEEAGMTLLGFVRQGRFNVYAGAERLGL